VYFRTFSSQRRRSILAATSGSLYLSAGSREKSADLALLDAAGATTPVYPYWHQRLFAERNPLPVQDKIAA